MLIVTFNDSNTERLISEIDTYRLPKYEGDTPLIAKLTEGRDSHPATIIYEGNELILEDGFYRLGLDTIRTFQFRGSRWRNSFSERK